jgi:hypothetical protein
VQPHRGRGRTGRPEGPQWRPLRHGLGTCQHWHCKVLTLGALDWLADQWRRLVFLCSSRSY